MADTKEDASKKSGKSKEFFKKHKNAILITSAVIALIVLYLYVKSRNSSTASSATVPANSPTGADNTGWTGNYSGNGQQTMGAAGNAGPAGPAGPSGPSGPAGPSGNSTSTVSLNPATPGKPSANPVINAVQSFTRIAAPVIAPAAPKNTALSNAAAFTKLTTAKKPVVSTIGTQKTVNPQGGNGRIITMPSFPAPAKSVAAKPVVKAVAKPAPKPAPAPVVKAAAPPRPAPSLTVAKVTAAAYAGRK
jgi:hypothetical protein